MRCGLRVPACAPASEVADFCERAERAGFDGIWVPDSQLLHRDVWATLAVIAARTSRVFLGPNVTNPLSRFPTVSASAAHTLAELSDDRLIVGIGSGESAVTTLGHRTATLAQIRAAIELMRALWAEQWIEQDGRRFRMRAASSRPIPVYIGASRKRMLQLAGEIADGAIMVTGISPEALEFGLGNIEIGAKRAGRTLDDVDVACGVYVQVTDDPAWAKKQAQPYAALYALRYQGTERDFGVTIPDGFTIHSVYPDLLHAEDWDEAIEKTEWVPDDVLEEYCETFTIIGTGEEIRARIRALEASGISNLYIRSFYTYDLPFSILQTFEERVPLSENQLSGTE
ncbi:LLM class flavin-dependent oxidoreductase [Actinopolymorpha alba]|uniref:LLM class flavin-dependent oxidoreductase n=1 Tax=Actinopolymorpha alba TaxID=533267 RepID=UPI0003AB1DA5|nr:LLM class flavin-dependent oxidoreductase [Actinopolymorpha alba]